jgi:diguanylate cyclase (GGDEF)-like protein
MRVSPMSKPAAAWVAAVVTLAIVLATALRATLDARATRALVAASGVTLDSLRETAAALARVEGAQRGYLLTGDRAYLAPYARDRRRVYAGLTALRRLDAPAARPRVARLGPLVHAGLAAIDESVALRRAGRARDALAVVQAHGGTLLLDPVREELDALRADEERRLALRAASAERAAAGALRGLWGALAAVALFAPLGWLALAADRRARRRAEEALATQSVTDPLTGLLNRRGFEPIAAHALAHAQRMGEPALVLYLDMDGFKEINDQRGHAAGDAALRDTAAALRSVFRESDVVARVGGDEFVVLACDATLADAPGLAERVRHALATRSWGDAPYAPRLLRASIGVAAFDPYRPTDLATLVHDADASMYAMKHLARVAA